MFVNPARGLAMACMAAVMLNPAPASAGCFDWLFGCCGHHHSTYSTYRPLFGGCGHACNHSATTAACNPCATQSCRMVQQTAYRAECVNVPVTTYQPVTTCDPCTGCPVTCMRPVTAMVRQVRYTPYTTCRQVCTPVCPTPCAPAHHVPVASNFHSPVTPAPSCCDATSHANPNGGHSNHSAPSTYTSPPGYSVPPTYSSPGTSGPTLQSSPSDATMPPMLNGSAGASRSVDRNSIPVLDTRPQATPYRRPNGPGYNPRGLFLEQQDRTTRLPQRAATGTSPLETAQVRSSMVPTTVPALYARPANTTIDDSGWRSARP